ncbi:MAG: hypothetical protein ACXABO_01485 [Promethearchaeota archaeon]|jgi:H+/Cl- antiporter ClcA
MDREKTTWFGIRLTQKQATSLFVLAIAGTFILSFTVMQLLYSLTFYFTNPYYDDLSYFWDSLLSMLPIYIPFFAGLILCIHTLLRSRNIAKSYDDVIFRTNSKSRAMRFCPNCGFKPSGYDKFCNNCGQELK